MQGSPQDVWRVKKKKIIICIGRTKCNNRGQMKILHAHCGFYTINIMN